MKIFFTTAALLGVAIISGCASVSAPYEYQEGHSKAYNIARAGGLVQDIEDTEVPADKIGSITESMTKVGFVAAGYMKPQLDMTNWQTMGVNLASELFEPDSHGARNSMMAWMPISEASDVEEAQNKFLSQVKDSVNSALSDLGANSETIYAKNGTYVTHFTNDEWNCPSYEAGKTTLDDLCRIRVKVYEPRNVIAPAFIAKPNEPRYVFSSGHGRNYQRLELLISEDSMVPEDTIYATISKYLPRWTYLYLAPGKVKTNNGEEIGFPYILNRGDVELFITPK